MHVKQWQTRNTENKCIDLPRFLYINIYAWKADGLNSGSVQHSVTCITRQYLFKRMHIHKHSHTTITHTVWVCVCVTFHIHTLHKPLALKSHIFRHITADNGHCTTVTVTYCGTKWQRMYEIPVLMHSGNVRATSHHLILTTHYDCGVIFHAIRLENVWIVSIFSSTYVCITADTEGHNDVCVLAIASVQPLAMKTDLVIVAKQPLVHLS